MSPWSFMIDSTGRKHLRISNGTTFGNGTSRNSPPQAAAHAWQLLWQFRTAKAPIFHIQHLATRPGATFFLPKTTGAQIHELVAPLPGEQPVTKHYPNSFRETTLLERLRCESVTDLVICGAISHMCSGATTRAAFDFGFNYTIVEDACATAG